MSATLKHLATRSMTMTTTTMERSLSLEAMLRLIAGFFVVASVLLGMSVDQRFLWFTLFVGANLFQSAFTNWCPMMTILRRAGYHQ
jgi:hypothetical protein